MLHILRTAIPVLSALAIGIFLSELLSSVFRKERSEIKLYGKIIFLIFVQSIIVTVPLYSGCFGNQTIEIFVNASILCLIAAIFIIPGIWKYFTCAEEEAKDNATRKLKIGFNFVLEFAVCHTIIYAAFNTF